MHYSNIIMGAIASRITSLTIVYTTVYSDADQRKHLSSMSLAFVRGPVNFPHKWPVTRKMFRFDDIIMVYSIWFPVCSLVDESTITCLSTHFADAKSFVIHFTTNIITLYRIANDTLYLSNKCLICNIIILNATILCNVQYIIYNISRLMCGWNNY